jgi:hypothetical protein
MRRIGMTSDPAEDFDDPDVDERPLRRHVVYQATRPLTTDVVVLDPSVLGSAHGVGLVDNPTECGARSRGKGSEVREAGVELGRGGLWPSRQCSACNSRRSCSSPS